MAHKRLFIALGFSKKFAQSVDPWVKKIKKTADQKEMTLKWIPPENYHITLVFLGNTPEEEIPRIQEKMIQVAESHSPFSLKIKELGGFPTLNQARVIYFGVQRSQALLNLQSELEQQLLSLEQVEHDYTPHLTLARLRNPKSCRDLLSPFAHVDLGRQEMFEIILFNSVMAGQFPAYQRLFEVPLKVQILKTEEPPVASE